MYTKHEHKKQDEVVEKDQALELFEAVVSSSVLSELAPSSEIGRASCRERVCT